MEIKSAISSMVMVLQNRNSVFSIPGVREVIDIDTIQQRVNYSILSTFEERCYKTGMLKASWIFNHEKKQWILNRIYRNKTIRSLF